MRNINRLYLDTNVFIAMAEGDDDLSSALYDLASSNYPDGDFLFTSELALAELLVKPYREQNDELISLYDNWIQPDGWLEAGPVDRNILRYAAVVREKFQGIKLPDAIHISTAIGFKCSHILTGDKRLPENLQLHHTRWAITQGPAELRTIRLNVENVNQIVDGRKR